MENLFDTTAFGFIITLVIEACKRRNIPAEYMVWGIAFSLAVGHAGLTYFGENSLGWNTAEFVVLVMGQASLIYGLLIKRLKKLEDE